FPLAFWVRPDLRPLESKDKKKPDGVIVARANAKEDSRGWQLRIREGKLEFTLAHKSPQNLVTVQTKEKVLIEGRWNHIVASYSGSGKADGMKLYVDARPQELKGVKDKLEGAVRTSAPMSFGRIFPDVDPLRQSAFQAFRSL